ncbi:hypothetical protein [Pelagicoccus albus]|uniref:DUF3301 domain-containing protein n=1 Tax=Pelagicoccus albus TaxID=415222 RepID=A0A7X1B8I6_9BACT|nr:hypothetical protein [Pelagicoccus albus]MBC2606330.1 hypothetical protein [Pelagicoccus albus]
MNYELIAGILILVGTSVLFIINFSDAPAYFSKKRIQAFARKRNWEVITLRQDTRYGYTDDMGQDPSASRLVFKLTYRSNEGVVMESIISSGFLGFDLEIQYEKPRKE